MASDRRGHPPLRSSLDEVARRFGWSRSPGVVLHRTLQSQWASHRRARAWELRDTGLDLAVVAGRLGVAKGTVLRYLRESPPLAPGRPWLGPVVFDAPPAAVAQVRSHPGPRDGAAKAPAAARPDPVRAAQAVAIVAEEVAVVDGPLPGWFWPAVLIGGALVLLGAWLWWGHGRERESPPPETEPRWTYRPGEAPRFPNWR